MNEYKTETIETRRSIAILNIRKGSIWDELADGLLIGTALYPAIVAIPVTNIFINPDFDNLSEIAFIL